ncbi:acyltransferase family protein [Planktothrix pseudagardhii]|uniref:Peptidoglycan/LPS O-acetylase OafA/YrhL n=1 Tax=Planktothrix pseudagardhii TaxID=132604 RepID=A0A9W4CIN2_9CYAN|nr:acyltransferase [Planktothrix pseudagardhii]CAD5940589.1 Peptidoglycan/LPS O-acetylase OafA/YrhL [Planktothrix pseudagardhii]
MSELEEKFVSRSMPRYPSLDGWRGISILCVLAAHQLPLGLKFWKLNSMSAALGMCLFFTLSGFLITSTLFYRSNIRHFLIRRFCRIIPLAWAFILIALPLVGAELNRYFPHFFFYANLPPFWLTHLTAHLWSVCVEMQFYIFIALLIGALGQRGLMLLPAFCFAVTANRIWHGVPISIETYYRVDEILVGACLALIYERRLGEKIPKFLGKINCYLLLLLLLISCHPQGSFLQYLRPYLAATLVGATLYQNNTRLGQLLTNRTLVYIATISYALYVIHPITIYGWLGSGDTIIRYSKRILSFLICFTLAHLSTFYYEKHWITWGKHLISQSK